MIDAVAAAPRAPGVRAARREASPGRPLARTALVVLLAAGAWLAFAAASNDWIVDTASAAEPGWLRGPLAGALPSLTDPSFSALLLIMLVAYLCAVACGRWLPERGALAVTFTLVVLFGLAPVVLSSDLFGYVAYAHLDVLHGLNPYQHAPSAAPHDPVLPLVYWQQAPTPYGPLYTALSLPLGFASLPAAVWLLKSLSTVSCLVALVLIARAAPLYGRSPGRAVLLVGANPLLLLYGVGGGHNDLVVLAAVAAAVLLLAPARRSSPAGAGVAFAVATALKASGGLLLPFALMASAGRRRILAGAAAASLALSAVALPLFGADLFGQLGRIATGGDFVADYSGPDLLGRLLGTGVTGGVRVASAAAAALVILACLRRVARGADWLAGAAVAGVAVLAAIPSLVPWYVAWVAPAAALARGRAPTIVFAGLTVVIAITRLPTLGFAPY